MNILAIGDLTEPRAVSYLESRLWDYRRENAIDLVIANGENASFITGPSPELVTRMLDAGVDVITGGNHTVGNFRLHPTLESTPVLLRPANYPACVPGTGYTVTDVCGYRLLVINVLGQVHMEPTLDSPFETVDRILSREAGNYDFAALDIHAEATGEKLALAHYFDGRIQIVFGTHTHVPTADARVLPKGTGYVTDIGMCGAADGILGVDKDVIVARCRQHLPVKYAPAEGEILANGAIFTLNSQDFSAKSVKIVSF